MSEPIIIIGLARSGTTYLARLLEKHDVKMYDWEMLECEEVDIWAANSVEIQRNKPDMAALPFRYAPSGKFIERLKEYHVKRNEGHLWGFKEPQICCLLPAYFEVWPNASYVCCVRNCLSSAWSDKFRHNQLMGAKDEAVMAEYALRLANVARVAAESKINIHLFNYDGNAVCEFLALGQYLGMDLKGWDTFKRSEASRESVHRVEMADVMARHRLGMAGQHE